MSTGMNTCYSNLTFSFNIKISLIIQSFQLIRTKGGLYFLSGKAQVGIQVESLYFVLTQYTHLAHVFSKHVRDLVLLKIAYESNR